MAARSLATARLMETWAHGLDCFAAFGVSAVDTARLRHVAWLGWKTLPHAFALAGVAPVAPPERLRVELLAPDGSSEWTYGPADARRPRPRPGWRLVPGRDPPLPHRRELSSRGAARSRRRRSTSPVRSSSTGPLPSPRRRVH